MADNSNIEWCDATWNPIRGLGTNRWQCQKISPGCDNCYASTMNHRWGGSEYGPVGIDIHGRRIEPEVRLDIKTLLKPMLWKRPRRIFPCSMTDMFGEWVPDEWIDEMVGVMRQCPQHQFLVLTKRPKRMLEYYAKKPILPNVWLGTTIELDRYTWRADYLRQTPAAVRFISAEPLLGPLPSLKLDNIDWLITGGESGARHRPFDLDWVRDLRDRARLPGVAFFHKQHGGRTHAEGGCLVDGIEIKEWPVPRLAA